MPYGIEWQAAVIREKKPWWLPRLLGAKARDGRGYRMRWGEWAWRWGIALELVNWGEDSDWSLIVGFIYGRAYIKLPFLPAREPDGMMESWGFSWGWDADNRGADIHLHWGERTKLLFLPWDYVHVRSDMLCDDGVWRKSIPYYDHKDGDPRPAVEAYDYRYVCRNGTVQDDITAVIHVQEMEWRWKLARWLHLPGPRLVRRTIEIEFSKEVGERRGSWKGGVLGCGYGLRPDETPAECLHRMQRDRRFD
jgi:hypothetical protein